jgi:hypothetical protein
MATLETRIRQADVSVLTKRYYSRQRKLNQWRAGKLPALLQQEYANRRGIDTLSTSTIRSTPPVRVKVRCSGTLHTCTVTPCGRITFHGHTREELRALRTMRALGDQTCGCLGLIDRVLTSEFWRGDAAVLLKTTQRTKPMRNAVQDSFRPSTMRPLDAKWRARRVRDRIMDGLRGTARSIERKDVGDGMYDDITTDVIFGIADATHAPGIKVHAAGERYDTARGWLAAGDVVLTIVVPLTWLLRVDDDPVTTLIAGCVCFGFRRAGDCGVATLAVRTSRSTFEMQEHDVFIPSGASYWKPVHAIKHWRP